VVQASKQERHHDFFVGDLSLARRVVAGSSSNLSMKVGRSTVSLPHLDFYFLIDKLIGQSETEDLPELEKSLMLLKQNLDYGAEYDKISDEAAFSKHAQIFLAIVLFLPLFLAVIVTVVRLETILNQFYLFLGLLPPAKTGFDRISGVFTQHQQKNLADSALPQRQKTNEFQVYQAQRRLRFGFKIYLPYLIFLGLFIINFYDYGSAKMKQRKRTKANETLKLDLINVES